MKYHFIKQLSKGVGLAVITVSIPLLYQKNNDKLDQILKKINNN